MGDPLDPKQAKERLDAMREDLGRPRAAPQATNDVPSVDEDSASGKGDLLDDPAAIAASMERAAHTDRLEQAIRDRDERIRQLENEIEHHRKVLSRMAGLLGEALTPALESAEDEPDSEGPTP